MAQLPIDKENVVRPLFQSKGFGANIITAVVVPAIWPLLPFSWRTSDWLPAFITAWSLIINAIFREITRNRAIKILDRMERDLGFQDTDRS